MAQPSAREGRRASIVASAFGALALVVAACGGSASPSASQAASVAPSVAAPSVPSVAPSVEPSVASVAPSVAASPSSSAVAVDPAKDLKIAAPYRFGTLDPLIEQTFKNQMSTSLGQLGSLVQFGFKQVDGGTGQTFVMVLAFPAGMLNDTTFDAMANGIGGSMQATLTTSDFEGVKIASGKASSGGIAVLHLGDHAVMVISQADTDAVPVAKALITANK
jgi:hypothetical protein